MYLEVQVTQDPSSRAGVAQVTIERAVRSRLRGAGMYQESLLDEQGRLSPILLVRVWLRGPAVHFKVLLMKQLIDYGADANMHATTWRIERLGAHRRNRGAVSQAIAEMVDEFLDEYLRSERGRLLGLERLPLLVGERKRFQFAATRHWQYPAVKVPADTIRIYGTLH